MKDIYNIKIDNLITEFKKINYLFVGGVAEIIEKFKPISRTEIRTALKYSGFTATREDLKLIYEIVFKKE